MKKILIAIVALIYLTVSSGLAINIHYCMGKIASADLFHTDSKQCGKCGMKSGNEGCCKDELKLVKLDDAHKLFNNDINVLAPLALLNTSFSNIDFNSTAVKLSSPLHNNSPPASLNPSLYILHCSFRI